jgi:UDP-N-acetylglucosamine--dolichyl-phosphate N-acetylglucosaminephosphotransferase
MEFNFAITLLMVFFTSLFLTFFAVPFIIKKLKEKNFVSRDMNKEKEIYIAKFGGAAVFLGFIIAILLPLQLTEMNLFDEKILITAALTTSLIAFLGFVDDILDIPDIYRVILPLFAAIPFILVMTHINSIYVPFIGEISLNVGTLTLPILGTFNLNIYIILLIPLGIIACSNLVNLLAGFNGLEAGTGIIISIFLLILLYINGLDSTKMIATYLLVGLIGALISFLIFNWYPAKVFPGNIVTYLIGSIIAVVVIIGGIEFYGAIVLAPQIIEFLLKALSKFKAENFGTCIDGKLNYTGKTYSLTHLIMKKLKPTEIELVSYIYAIQIGFGILAIFTLII